MKKSSARKQLFSFVTSNTKIKKIKEVLAFATDNCGRTPLFHAVSQQMNGLEAIQSLLDGGADPDILNNTGESVLDTVISERYNEEGYYLLEKKLIELGFKEGADIKGEPKSVWERSKDQSKGFVPPTKKNRPVLS